MLVFTDRATKMVHLVPTSAKVTAIDAPIMLVVNVVNHHGPPRSLISDHNQITISEFWKHVCAMLDYQSYYATSLHLQRNGQAECTVQTDKLFLCMATLKVLNWFNVLAVAELSTNSAPLSYIKVFSFV